MIMMMIFLMEKMRKRKIEKTLYLSDEEDEEAEKEAKKEAEA